MFEALVNKVLDMNRAKQFAFCALVLLFFLFLCFSSSLQLGLFADDFIDLKLLLEHPFEMLKQGFSGLHMKEPEFGRHYRPLLTFPYLIDLYICGTNPFLLHISNLLWHYAVTLLVFLLLEKLLTDFKYRHAFAASFWAALFFELHPFHCEAIDWWVAKNDIIAAFWYLLAFFWFLKTRENKVPWQKCPAPAFYLVAIASKESAVTLAAVIFVFAYLQSQKMRLFARISDAFDQSKSFFLILVIFCILRAFVLGTFVGGYYGLINQYWLDHLSARLFDPLKLSILLFPIDIGLHKILAALSSIFLALAYFISVCNFIRCSGGVEGRGAKKALLFFSLMFLLSLFPALLIWVPRFEFYNTRLLYISVLPLCSLVAILLTLKSKVVGNYLLLSVFALTLLLSSISFQERFLCATRFYANLAAVFAEEPANSKVLFVTVPGACRRVTLGLTYKILAAALSETFAKKKIEVLALEPFFYYDSDQINLSRLKELADRRDSYKAVFLSASNNGEALFERVDPADFVAAEHKPDLSLFPRESKNASAASYLFLLPQAIHSADYQILKLHFNKGVGEKALHLSVFCKSADASGFSSDRSFEIDENITPGSTELILPIGHRLAWLKSRSIDAIEIYCKSQNSEIFSIELCSGKNYVPELKAQEPSKTYRNDSVLQSAHGKFYFSYDASRLRGAEAVRVEISLPLKAFKTYSKLRDSAPCPWLSKSFMIDGAKGKFDLSARLGEPVWYQIRILAVSKKGKVLGYSSDPISLQSEGTAN
ncbi:MAG: hypothetical protein K2X27_18670 [Candidatus Obscuribacterales bacterium]|nr:hypothetical protein [Candidatus Obscuribacterales bacterium]